MLAKADNRSADAGAVRGSEKRDIEDRSFGSLTGTQKESDELIKKFDGWGWTPTDFTAKEATKEALLKIHSPYILHLATHGFFAKEDPTATKNESESPMNDQQRVTKSKFFKNPIPLKQRSMHPNDKVEAEPPAGCFSFPNQGEDAEWRHCGRPAVAYRA